MSMTFVCASPSSTLVLKNAELLDTRRVDFKTIVRETPAAERIVFRPPSWVNAVTHLYSFHTLTDAKLTELRAFLELTAGYQLTITDHAANVVIGFILTPVFNIVTRQDVCSYDVELEILEYLNITDTSQYLLTQASERMLTEAGELLQYEY